MNWQFIDMNTLEEERSGYKIHLLSGTWFHPGKLKPEFPPHIELPEQMQLLRSGLSHIRSIGFRENQQELKEEKEFY